MEEKKNEPFPEKERGRYHNDYSPRYQPPYDIYEKARNHMKSLKRKGDQEDLGPDMSPMNSEREKNTEKQRKNEKNADK